MIVEFSMPKFGQVMEEGTIVKWFKKEGDSIHKGEIIVEIGSDKASFELESDVTGKIHQILVKEDETVAINTVLATIQVD
jgi:pyruvate/2-oxoglutarate dehydrogenase complex dihydrolipoamide acyltransferase (E2) component